MAKIATLLMLTALFAADPAVSPYAGQQQRQIKALPESDIEGFLSGAGMGFAKAAELNGYPGPKHVLELATELSLSVAQISATESLYRQMQRQATGLGRRLVAAEAELDQQFEAGSIDSAILQRLVTEIAELQGRIRYVHLEAHLKQKALLDAHQVRHYNRLRGYGHGDARHAH